MKKNVLFILTTTFYILSTVLSGCATVKEMGKGFIGVSTQILEEKRKDALKKSFALSYNDCYAKVKDILTKNILAKDTLDKESSVPYIYSEDSKKKVIAIYLSQADTTPVGIFFTEEASGNILIEISSPSIYAKEEIAHKVFTGIDELIKPKVEPQGSGLASDGQSREEKKINVKEKSGN